MGPAGYGCGADLSGEGLAGQPFVNGHSARHVQAWAAFLVASGQQTISGALVFSPRCFPEGWAGVGVGARMSYPFFTPTALGLLHVTWPGGAQLQVLSGSVPQTEVHFNHCVGPSNESPSSTVVVI